MGLTIEEKFFGWGKGLQVTVARRPVETTSKLPINEALETISPGIEWPDHKVPTRLHCDPTYHSVSWRSVKLNKGSIVHLL